MFTRQQQTVKGTIVQGTLNLIAIDLSKQQKLYADPKALQQINFTGNIEKETSIFSIIEQAKETVLDFSKVTFKVF